MLGVILAAVVLILVIVLLITGYKKAPPDTAYIISGLRKKIIIGKASIKIPFLERMDTLSLKLIAIDVKTSNAVPTADYINIQVDAAVNIKISSEPARLALAAENFLNQNTQYIANIAREVLEGNMREIVGRMRLEEMVSDRQKFANLVKENAEPDLAAMGLDIVSFNVQNFADGNGVIDDLGIDNISQIKKKAAIAKAEAEKEIAVAKAEADKQANDARINAEREIAKKNNRNFFFEASVGGGIPQTVRGAQQISHTIIGVGGDTSQGIHGLNQVPCTVISSITCIAQIVRHGYRHTIFIGVGDGTQTLHRLLQQQSFLTVFVGGNRTIKVLCTNHPVPVIIAVLCLLTIRIGNPCHIPPVIIGHGDWSKTIFL